MKALSVNPVDTMLIFAKQKTIECRTWDTSYRGPIVICSTAKKIHDTIPGHALCVVDLVDIVPFRKHHLGPACMTPAEYLAGRYAWQLDNLRYIRPVPVKGKLSLWNLDDDLIEYIEEPKTEEEDDKLYHELYEPLFV